MDISTRTRREATSREDQTTSLSIAQIRITRTRVRRKEKGKSKTRHTGEAHLGIEWDSSDESTDDEDVATIAMEARTTKSSLFGELTDDEDDFTHTYFMAKEAKVYSCSSPDSDDDMDDNELENMIPRRKLSLAFSNFFSRLTSPTASAAALNCEQVQS